MEVTLAIEALTPRLSGIGRYVWELCKGVPEQPNVDRVSYFANGRFLDDPSVLLRRPLRLPRRLPRWVRGPIHKRRFRSNLVHGPNYFLPADAETGVITIHDLSVFRFPDAHPAERVRHFERDFQLSLDRARHVITDTETVRQELISDFAVSGKRVSAIPLGVSGRYRPRTAEELRPILRQWRLSPNQYALCVSTLEPRKKISELIHAWRELSPTTRDDIPLVLAGAEGWLNQNLHEEIGAAVAAGWLKHLGFVDESELSALYAGAALFVYPSIYEGFGLPPIEAMASGIPAVVSNSSCLPEVCGDAALYVDPNDIPRFSVSLATALRDGQWRDGARQRGLKRAARFTWESCIEQTVNIYRENG